MTMRRKISLLAACAVLTGCETLGSNGVDKAERSGSGEALAAAGLGEAGQTLGALQESSIPEKSCGMVLWTLEAQRPVAVFRFIVGETGQIQLANRVITLNRYEYDGATGFGVFERQTFHNEEGFEVEVSTRFGLGFDGGAYLERGLIKVRDASGWSIVAPVAGIAGCRT